MKVLVIDDESLVRRSLERAFTSVKWEVRVAEDGPSGMRLWQAWLPDVVLIDVLMPGMTGPQVLEQLGPKYYLDTVVVVMSAFTGAQSEFQGEVGQSVDLFVSKPFEDIISTVDRITKLVQK